MQAAKLYADVHGALQSRDIEQAARRLNDLSSDHGRSAYTQQGRLLLAKAHVEAGKFDEAIALLQEVAATATDKELAQIARLRTARLLIQQGKHDDALKLLDAESAGAFAAQAREVRGDALAAKGDQEGARAEYAAALADERRSADRPHAARTQTAGRRRRPSRARSRVSHEDVNQIAGAADYRRRGR